MILISIVVPVYNVEKYLPKCIDSLLSQTLKDIEIIIVNDGSTDSCKEICDKYKKMDSRIKVINKMNEGLSEARNTGIRIAQGEYIAFIDSDDWIHPEFCAYLYQLINQNNADIAQCNYIKVYNEDYILEDNKEVQKNIYSGIEALNLLYTKEYGQTVIACNKLYKKNLFNQIKFTKGKIHEDEFTTYKLLYLSKRIVCSDIEFYYYRQRVNSITSQKFSYKRLDAIEAWEERNDFLKSIGLKSLVKKNEKLISDNLKIFYYEASKSDLKNKRDIMKKIKKIMKKYCLLFLTNNYITLKGKISILLCIFNGKLFCKLYNK